MTNLQQMPPLGDGPHGADYVLMRSFGVIDGAPDRALQTLGGHCVTKYECITQGT